MDVKKESGMGKIVIDNTMALVIVDMENGFMPGNELPVPGADEIIPMIVETAKQFRPSRIVLTKEEHPADHCSFKERGGPFASHCVRGTIGCRIVRPIAELLGPTCALIWYKAGEPDIDAFGAFADNNGVPSGLKEQLRYRGIKTLFLNGVAFEYCVGTTAEQAVEAGFEVYIIEDETRAVDPTIFEEKKSELMAKGVKFIMSEDLVVA